MFKKKFVDLVDINWKNEKAEYVVKQWESSTSVKNIGNLFLETRTGEDTNDILFDSELNLPLIGNIKTKSEINCSKTTLRPSNVYISFKKSYEESVIEAEYESSKIKVNIMKDGKYFEANQKIDYKTFDNNQVFSALRYLPRNADVVSEFSIYNLLTATNAECSSVYEGEETIFIDDKSFECFKINLKLTVPREIDISLFYSLEAPHYLVRYVMGPEVIELKNIEFGD